MRPDTALRAHGRALAFVLKLLPMLPSAPVDLFTGAPVRERISYPSHGGTKTADLYRPPDRGPHPGMVMSLGVVPFGVDHPQVPRLCEALARSGFVGLIHWSDTMRDLRLAPEDVDDVALAYRALLARDDVDASRSGLYGTCVGGSFALLAAAHPIIRDRVAFVGAFAPYASMRTLAKDVMTRTRGEDGGRVPWAVDQITRDVFQRTVASLLAPEEARALLEAVTPAAAEAALGRLSASARERLDAMSPLCHVAEIHAPVIAFGHDRDDLVIPVEESRRLARAFGGRARYTEYAMFEHADPTKRKLSPLVMLRELGRFYGSLYPLFRQAV